MICDRRAHRQTRDGVARLPDGTFAGSILIHGLGFEKHSPATGRSLAEAWPMSSLNAARAVGVSARKGSLETGKDADLVLLDGDFQVRLTVAEGEIVYEA
jgi:N-acetylglucosamine-6-phosphate deacetylase